MVALEVDGNAAPHPVLLIYYSAEAHRRLAASLEKDGFAVYTVDGRAHDASDDLRAHPSRVVVIDRSAEDVNVTQAVRRVGQILPESIVAIVVADTGETHVFRGGRRIGVESTLRDVVRRYGVAALP